MKKLLLLLICFPLITAFSPISTPTEKGNQAYRTGKFDDALEAYQEAAKDNPGKAEAHYNLGGAYYKKGEYDKALAEYEKAVKLDPKMAEGYYNMGDSLYRMGEYEQALKAFQAADSLKRQDPDTVHNIEVTRLKVKEEQERKKRQAKNSKGPEKQGQGLDKRNQAGGGGQGANQNGQDSGGGKPSGPQLSNEEVQAMLNRQKEEEHQLRNYFRPGKKDKNTDREAQIEQILRSIGAPVPGHPAQGGSPRVEKDW